MRTCYLVAALLGLTVGLGPAPAADLAKVDRTIRKEPTYRSKNPAYGLLVFGPEAKARVWLVRDGDALYIDKNGNGDLTEPGERLPLPQQGDYFPRFEVASGDGTARYRVQLIEAYRLDPKAEWRLRIEVVVIDKFKQYGSFRPGADRAKAPVAHFDGPLTAHLSRVANGAPIDKLVTGDMPEELFVEVGTIDQANGCWVVLENRDFRADVNPVVEVAFPAKGFGEKPIRRRYVLKERC